MLYKTLLNQYTLLGYMCTCILIHVNQIKLVRINLYEEKGIQRMNF